MELFNMKLNGIICTPEHYGAIFSMGKKLCCVSGDRNGLSFCRHDTKYIPNGVVPPWRQTSTYNLNGHAGVLSKRSMKAVVTGGGGYFGYSLGCALAKSGASVILYDIQKPPSEVPNGAAFIQADVRNYDALFAACEGADCVFHVASYGMSGLEQLQRKQVESINIGGTKFIIDVCKQRNVPRLVYTSTINVVFGGNHIEEGDEETVPYFPLEKHIDHYSKTKSIADQMVLAANASLLSGGDKLRTCVLRPPGIYGPQEQRHLPRIARNIERGFFRFRFGEPTAQMNWVHVENLVQAHILAAEALTSEKNYIASGQAYYINDGENVNLFEWITPLFEKLGYSQPWIRIPTSLVYAAATTIEYLHFTLRPLLEVSPLLTRNEVWNVAVTHTFRIDKARNQLGYCPKKFAFADSVDHFIKTRPKSQNHHFFLKILLSFIASLLSLILLSFKFESLSIMQFFKENQH
ncbi:LOW QUALITY PROTEIN: putative short-chain dehydrogenase/reductase family 42E member 2 [Alligator mississippiensis]|uniref:LOW QUALITY PROTEIN: putative short-chain dehydrogenase/reductase family 42E member 2 n=1 Tax=Alligator mississippiensis TaxID=8496 RepID=UPI0009072F51|nr:LOW QUALITY PROTEIN: putative short-chain dehydrogenase/reductase family 42E member 2 [Alligator mississippiensis]